MKFNFFCLFFALFSLSLAFADADSEAELPIPSNFKKLTKSRLLKLRDPTTGIIQLTDKTSNLLLDTEVRQVPVMLLLTANSPAIGCSACQDFKPVFEKTARQYIKLYPNNNDLFFVNADFSQNQALFKRLGMNNVPHVWVLPKYDFTYNRLLDREDIKDDKELEDPKHYRLETSEHFEYRISEGSTPVEFAAYISAAIQQPFVIPGDSDGIFNENTFAIAIFTFSLVVIIKKKVNDPDSTLLQKLARPRVWTGISVLLITLFTSGYMFTIIRGVPLLARNENGPFYFAGGAQYQIGIEAFLVAGSYLFIGFWMVLLIDVLPKRKWFNKVKLSDTQQAVLTIIAAGGLYYAYSLLTSIYLRKDGGYPFALSKVL